MIAVRFSIRYAQTEEVGNSFEQTHLRTEKLIGRRRSAVGKPIRASGDGPYSTVTDFARFLGLSMSFPRASAE